MEWTTFGWVDYRMFRSIFESPWDFEVSSFNWNTKIMGYLPALSYTVNLCDPHQNKDISLYLDLIWIIKHV